MQKSTGIVLGVAGVAVLAAIWAANARGGGERGEASVPPRSSSTSTPQPAAPAEPPAAGSDADADARTAVPQALPAPGSSAAADPSEQDGVAAGTLVVVDAAGREHPAENGVLRLGPLAGGGRSRDVPVTDGNWSVELAAGRVVRVISAELGERVAVEPSATFLSARAAPYELRMRWLPFTLLHVVDAASGLELDGVELTRERTWEDRQVHPAEGTPRVLTGGSSPIRLSGGPGLVSYRVRAPGFAWERIEIDHDQGAERTVALVRGCRLTVYAGEHEVGASLEARLYPGGYAGNDPVYVGAPLPSGGRAVFAGLRPGDYQVRAEVGRFFDPPALFAQRELTIAAGEEREVLLEIEAGASGPPPAPLAGSLELPQGAAQLPCVLEIQRAHGPALRAGDAQRIPLADMQSAAEPGRYRWDAGRVTPGRVKLVVHPFQVSTVIDLPGTGDRGVALTVPELGRVFVRVVDATHRLPAAVPFVAWSCFDPALQQDVANEPGSEGERALAMELLDPGHAGVVDFLAPVGRILIGTGGSGYEEKARWVDVAPGRNDVEFVLAWRTRLVLGFLDGDALVPPPPGLTVREVDGDAEWQRWARIGSRIVGVFERPGSYLIEAGTDGELTFEPRLIRISDGESLELDLAIRHR